MTTKLARYCEGIMEAAWLAALILVPVFFDTYSARIFEPDKITLLRSLAILILVAWMVKLVDEGRIRWEKLPAGSSIWEGLRKVPLFIPVLLLGIVYIITTIFSVAPQTSLWGSYQRLQGTYTTFSYLIIFAAMLGNLRRKKQVDRLITSIILASLPVSLFGILQRLKVDPIPWGADVTVRVAANLGNSIFVAAYLIMVFPLTVGRIVETFDAILKENTRLSMHVARGTVYVFIAAVQLITIYLSGSRGPFLGLFASGFFLLLLLSVRWRKRWLTFLVIAGAILGSAGLLLLNVQNGPLESFRSLPYVGRFGQILNPDSRNALVRKYIWEGAAKLVSEHKPIEFPDGRKDGLNFIRPLIGYGPESLYVAYNPFYPPLLGQVEKRNASPDRAHNETWDSLVFTGWLGFAAYLFVIMSIFYFCLKWMGLVNDRKQQILFIIFSLGGGLIGAGLMILWGGVEFFGVGLPFGIVIGLILYLVYIAVTNKLPAPKNPGKAARSLMLTVLLAAILAHYAEINFGIAIAVTRTYFWVFGALIVLVGYILPLYGQYSEESTQSVLAEPNKAEAVIEKKGSRAKRRKDRPSRTQGGEWIYSDLVEGGTLVGLLLVTLNYDFLLNQTGLTSTLRIFWTSLTQLPDKGNTFFPGILMLFITTWLMSTVIIASESLQSKDARTWGKSLGITLGVSGGIGLLLGLFHSALLARMAAIIPTNQDELLQKVNSIGGVLTNFYFWIFVFIFGFAYLITRDRLLQPGRASRWGWLSAPVLLILFVIAAYNSNLRIIQADIAFKMADPFTTGDQWPVASLLYRHAIELAPNEDYYYLFLGRSYLEEAKTITDETAQQNLVKQAEADLRTAQMINPLNTDHTANLARLYSWWAAQTNDPEKRKARSETASDYYSKSVMLSPNNSTLWGEWAVLLLDLDENPEAARQKLEYAINLDPKYSFTQSLMGDYYVKTSRLQSDQATRIKDLQTARDYFQEAVRVAKPEEKTYVINSLVSLGNTFIEQASLNPDQMDPALLQQAVPPYLDAIAAKPDKADRMRIEEQIARLYLELGDKSNALLHAQNALKNAGTSDQEHLNQLVAQIESLP